MSLDECRMIELPVVEDPQGTLAFAEAERHVPFPVARAFHVFDVPAGAARGGHSHLTLEQAVFCVSGRLQIHVDDGERRRSFMLDDPRRGLYLPPLVWHDIDGFGPGSVYYVLASAWYDEADYIRDRERFLDAVRASAADA